MQWQITSISTTSQYFSGTLPTRTTVGHHAPVERKPEEEDKWPALEEIALIAVR
jgi:hypothetical protein